MPSDKKLQHSDQQQLTKSIADSKKHEKALEMVTLNDGFYWSSSKPIPIGKRKFLISIPLFHRDSLRIFSFYDLQNELPHCFLSSPIDPDHIFFNSENCRMKIGKKPPHWFIKKIYKKGDKEFVGQLLYCLYETDIFESGKKKSYRGLEIVIGGLNVMTGGDKYEIVDFESFTDDYNLCFKLIKLIRTYCSNYTMVRLGDDIIDDEIWPNISEIERRLDQLEKTEIESRLDQLEKKQTKTRQNDSVLLKKIKKLQHENRVLKILSEKKK